MQVIRIQHVKWKRAKCEIRHRDNLQAFTKVLLPTAWITESLSFTNAFWLSSLPTFQGKILREIPQSQASLAI